jgi:peptidoglycan-associated lipoprotein
MKALGYIIFFSFLVGCAAKRPNVALNEMQEAQRLAFREEAPRFAPKEYTSAQEAMDQTSHELNREDYPMAEKDAIVAKELFYLAKVAAVRNKELERKALEGAKNIELSELDRHGGKIASLPDELEAAESFEDKKVSESVSEEFAKEGLLTVYFPFDSYTIQSSEVENIKKNVDFLKKYAELKIVIAGHGDARGSNEYNVILGEMRANSIRKVLRQYGVEAERVQITSFGEEKPAISGDSEEAWSKNRRAEFEITQ